MDSGMIVTILLAIIALIVIVGFVIWFIKLPGGKKIENIKQWLKYAVTEAEAYFGSGVGEIKLRYVYDMAIQKFPWVEGVISFETFSNWVDEALEWMNKQLQENQKVKDYITRV